MQNEEAECVDDTVSRRKVDAQKLTDLLEVREQLEKLTEKQKMFIAGAIAALSAKPGKDSLVSEEGRQRALATTGIPLPG
jgi:L-lactate utilization protein LutB